MDKQSKLDNIEEDTSSGSEPIPGVGREEPAIIDSPGTVPSSSDDYTPMSSLIERYLGKSIADSINEISVKSISTNELVENLARTYKVNSESIISIATVLLGIALKAEGQGLHLAVIDEDDRVVADIESVIQSLEEQVLEDKQDQKLSVQEKAIQQSAVEFSEAIDNYMEAMEIAKETSHSASKQSRVRTFSRDDLGMAFLRLARKQDDNR